ncbi:restriction endonuclease subunit S [Aquabacterium sp. A7-Y]|uniref:restriction endonuclease subunit S n=1 Tax=Aquabacterium sp. A7-Y TaxID=1349605 RepID=UPI00223DB61E|nr:restriction endonuclease subunit S [Aquabacterium sp. A7-Y]MCW7536279.1 restriction endonuclease subunit S [Aquabacterium sp. A7-Y]
MQSEWPLVPVADCCDLIVDCVNKTAPVVDLQTPYKMIRTTNVRRGFIDLTDCKFVDESTFRTWTRRAAVLDGDVVLTREAPIGEVGLVRGNQTIFLGQRLMQYRANKSVLDPRFLCYSFLSPQLQHQFGAHEGSGSVVSHIRVGDCSKFKIPLPPLSKQREIANLLGSIDERWLLFRQTNATLESIAQAVFKSWFIDFDPVRAKAEGREPEGMDADTAALFPAEFEESALGLIPKGWTAKPFGSLLAHAIGGDWGSEAESVDCSLPATVIRGTDIPDICAGRYQAVPRRFVSPRKAAKRLLHDGDLVIEVSGGSKTQPTGRSLYVTRDLLAKLGAAAVPTSFCRLFRAKDSHTALVLARHLAQIYQAGKMWNYQVQSTGLANFQTQHFLDSEMVVTAPPAIFERFFELVRPLIDRVYAAPIAELEALRDSLLPRLISGKLRLPEAQAQLERALA